MFCLAFSDTELKFSEFLTMAGSGTSERPMEKSLPNVYPLFSRVKEETKWDARESCSALNRL